jgi:hypothetical protein
MTRVVADVCSPRTRSLANWKPQSQTTPTKSTKPQRERTKTSSTRSPSPRSSQAPNSGTTSSQVCSG